MTTSTVANHSPLQAPLPRAEWVQPRGSSSECVILLALRILDFNADALGAIGAEMQFSLGLRSDPPRSLRSSAGPLETDRRRVATNLFERLQIGNKVCPV